MKIDLDAIEREVKFSLDFKPELMSGLAMRYSTTLLALISEIRSLREVIRKKDNALMEALRGVQVNRIDFERLRVQRFVEFNVHELDTVSADIQNALRIQNPKETQDELWERIKKHEALAIGHDSGCLESRYIDDSCICNEEDIDMRIVPNERIPEGEVHLVSLNGDRVVIKNLSLEDKGDSDE